MQRGLEKDETGGVKIRRNLPDSTEEKSPSPKVWYMIPQLIKTSSFNL